MVKGVLQRSEVLFIIWWKKTRTNRIWDSFCTHLTHFTLVTLYVSIFAEIPLTPASPPERKMDVLVSVHHQGLENFYVYMSSGASHSRRVDPTRQLILLLGWKSGTLIFFSTVFMKMADRRQNTPCQTAEPFALVCAKHKASIIRVQSSNIYVKVHILVVHFAFVLLKTNNYVFKHFVRPLPLWRFAFHSFGWVFFTSCSWFPVSTPSWLDVISVFAHALHYWRKNLKPGCAFGDTLHGPGSVERVFTWVHSASCQPF